MVTDKVTFLLLKNTELQESSAVVAIVFDCTERWNKWCLPLKVYSVGKCCFSLFRKEIACSFRSVLHHKAPLRGPQIPGNLDRTHKLQLKKTNNFMNILSIYSKGSDHFWNLLVFQSLGHHESPDRSLIGEASGWILESPWSP